MEAHLTEESGVRIAIEGCVSFTTNISHHNISSYNIRVMVLFMQSTLPLKEHVLSKAGQA
jgi:hypothetical protein